MTSYRNYVLTRTYAALAKYPIIITAPVLKRLYSMEVLHVAFSVGDPSKLKITPHFFIFHHQQPKFALKI